MSQITRLSISILKVHPQNQEFFDDIEGEQYERFKKSIKEDGVITPIIVSPDMTIISGHQRYKASKDLGLKLVPTIIEEHLIDEDEKLKKLLASNFGRLKNNPVKQGRVYEEYERLAGVRQGSRNLDGQFDRERTQEDVAKELGVSVETIKRLKRLNTLSPELQQLIEDGQVKYTTALNIWGKLSNDEQREFIETVGKDHVSNLTAKETEKLIKKYNLLQKENEELRNQEPIEVYPDDYGELKTKLQNTVDKEDFNTLRKEFQEKVYENHDLKRQIEQLAQTDSKAEHKEKLKDTTLIFCNKVHLFLQDVGGLAWLTEYIHELEEYEQESYRKSLKLLDEWLITVKSNLDNEVYIDG